MFSWFKKHKKEVRRKNKWNNPTKKEIGDFFVCVIIFLISFIDEKRFKNKLKGHNFFFFIFIYSSSFRKLHNYFSLVFKSYYLHNSLMFVCIRIYIRNDLKQNCMPGFYNFFFLFVVVVELSSLKWFQFRMCKTAQCLSECFLLYSTLARMLFLVVGCCCCSSSCCTGWFYIYFLLLLFLCTLLLLLLF